MNVKIIYRLIAFACTLTLSLLFKWEWIQPEWLQRVLLAIVDFILFLTISELLKHIFIVYYKKSKKIKAKSTDNIIQAIHNLHYIIISFVLLITVLRFFNIGLFEAITSLSIVAAAIAIISKDYLSNIISGLITVFTKELEIDDFIQIQQHKGKVLAITLSKVVLLNDDDDVVYIPNNIVFASDFINYTKRKVKKTSVDFEMKNDRISSADEIKDYLIKSLKSYQTVIVENSYNLRIEEIKADYTQFKFQYTVNKNNRELEREIRRSIKKEILQLMSI